MNPTTNTHSKVRQMHDAEPYPNIPIATLPQDNLIDLYLYNLVTSYYLRNRQVISTQGKVILDAGCGTGYKCLNLAFANPGAKIVGVDFSEPSIAIARERLQYHNIADAEFHVLALENLPSLGLQFDYINIDEVLYFLPDPVAGLQAVKTVLRPDGIIRTNFHSSLQRFVYYRAQELFSLLGLTESSPDKAEFDLTRGIMHALKEDVFLKSMIWKPQFQTDDQMLLQNFLNRGDKGWTISQLFSALRDADLEFISMVNWWQWDLTQLFQNFDDLPVDFMIRLAEMSTEEQLHLFELFHPIHRLLDIWCGHPDAAQSSMPVFQWTVEHWQQATVHLHPQFCTPMIRDEMVDAIIQQHTFDLGRYFRMTNEPVTLDSTIAACLLPLVESPQPMLALVQRWQQIQPLHPLTLESITEWEAFDRIKDLLVYLEELGYVLLETGRSG
ncbi:MAG: class I SAM-dependent methyltransferase [Scytolyngbya sp. HA4215-MV1]|jgi:2-polyprenyl-3-methyl-5-hydroxy-6-metoxy-1,4-benzoquinol methylase|nr:class I SAM-dependent methyltransferase [Scytolyngbya sp. HA4215-MV1]